MNAWGHSKTVRGAPWQLTVLLLAYISSADVTAKGGYTYSDGVEQFPYALSETGENHSFEFARNPGKQEERLRAALHVLQTVYADGSIDPRHRRFFTKEGAKCFVFEGNFYTYTSCFLPNDYSPGNENRFWGFVTRVPNGLWLITRNLLPALLLVGGFLFFMLRKEKKPKVDQDSQAGRSAGRPAL